MSDATGTREPRLSRKSSGEINCVIGSLRWYSRHCASWTVLLFALVVIPYLYDSNRLGIDYVSLLGQYITFAIVAVSLDLVWGYAGLLCLCQALFFCLGGYAMGMYLAHHGGPEGIIDHNGWKIPACLYVVYPYAVGEAPADALVPWFWKPFWTLWATLILGLIVPGVIAGVIGFFVFRSRVRGVFFAVLTQAITLAAWLVFILNNMKLGGTNGLTRFDRVILGTHEKVVVQVEPGRLSKTGVSAQQVKPALQSYIESIPGASIKEGELSYLVNVPHGRHPWNTKEALDAVPLGKGSQGEVHLRDVAETHLAGLQLTDSKVKLGLYILSVLSLGLTYAICQFLIKSRVGRVLIAIRDNENRLRFFGFEPYHFKVFVFATSAMLAGLGGMLYVPQKLIITPQNMAVLESIMVVIWVAVGGRSTLSGAILGTLVVKMAYYYFTSQREFLWFIKDHVPGRVYNWFIWRPDYWQFILGGMFVIVVVFLPDGLISIWHRWTRRVPRAKDPDDLPAPGPDAKEGNDERGAGLQDHLQRVALLQRTRTISQQRRSLLDSELVRVENVKVLFDGFKALDVDEFCIDYYELQVVIGPNGAGKTTLCDVISGKTRATSGKIHFGKTDITRMPEVDIARLGVGRKFQTPNTFDGLTVYECMELAIPGNQSLARNFRRGAAPEDRDRIHSILKRVRLDGESGQRVKYLSHGQRQWLEISMLLLARPHLLLVDEPAAGLTDEETALTAELLLELQDEHSVIVIEHDMEFVRLLNAPVTVLNEGKIMAQGSLEQVQADPKVVEAYLGRGGTRHATG